MAGSRHALMGHSFSQIKVTASSFFGSYTTIIYSGVVFVLYPGLSMFIALSLFPHYYTFQPRWRHQLLWHDTLAKVTFENNLGA